MPYEVWGKWMKMCVNNNLSSNNRCQDSFPKMSKNANHVHEVWHRIFYKWLSFVMRITMLGLIWFVIDHSICWPSSGQIALVTWHFGKIYDSYPIKPCRQPSLSSERGPSGSYHPVTQIWQVLVRQATQYFDGHLCAMRTLHHGITSLLYYINSPATLESLPICASIYYSWIPAHKAVLNSFYTK